MRCSNHDANQDACFTFEDPYNAALERVRSSQVCELLEDVEVNGFAVVDVPKRADVLEVMACCLSKP